MSGGRRKINPFNKDIEAAADAAQAKQQGGNNGILALRSLLGGSRTPPRSNSEALGRAFQTFILPMIIQGAQEWKANYDARGDFKYRGDSLLKAKLAGEQLSQQDQALLDNYASRYPKEYAAALAAAQAPANDVNTSTMMDYIRSTLPNTDWQRSSETLPEANGAPFSGVNYNDRWAQDTQQIMSNLMGNNSQQDDGNNILKWLNGIRW